VVFDNIASESPCCQDPYPGAQFGPDCPGSSDQCTGAWPIPTQIGTGIHETTNSPVYVWGNSGTVNGATQSIQGSISYTNGTQEGATPTSCTHPGDVCDVVVTATAPSTWVRCQSAADVAAGCPVAYTYNPYTYPHPLDDLPMTVFGGSCVVQEGDAGSATEGGAPPGTDAGSGSDSGSGDAAGPLADGSPSGDSGEVTPPATGKSGCGCGMASPRPDFATFLAIASAVGAAVLRRRRGGTRARAEKEALAPVRLGHPCPVRPSPYFPRRAPITPATHPSIERRRDCNEPHFGSSKLESFHGR
jgi:hypothetical protein